MHYHDNSMHGSLLYLILIPILLLIPVKAKSHETDTIPYIIKMFKIVEAYSFTEKEDSVRLDTLNSFLNVETDIFFIYIKHTDTMVVRIQQKDSVILAGLTVKNQNLGLHSIQRDEVEFFTGDFWFYENSGEGAVMKEYITNSYQERKKMYYYFYISLPFQHLELQLIGFDANPFTQDDPIINAIKKSYTEPQ